MASEMRMRVARVLCKLAGDAPDDLCTRGNPKWLLYDEEACAAIAAMRELPEMEAVRLLRAFNLVTNDLHIQAACEWHSRMIGAALV